MNIKAIYYPSSIEPVYREHEFGDLYESLWVNKYRDIYNRLVDELEGGFDPGDENGDRTIVWKLFVPHGRTDADIENPFVWKTHKGITYYPEQMETPHLFYSVRMLFNNVVPAPYRVGEFKSYPDIKTWSPGYLYAAMYALASELFNREDLDSDLADQLEEIKLNAAWLYRVLKVRNGI
jgi:hypothetical protein